MTGSRIRQRRKELKMTQSVVGRLVRVSKATVSLWECDETTPNGSNLQKLAEVLLVTPEWILTGKEGSKSREYLHQDVPLIDKADIGLFLSGKMSPKGDAGVSSGLIVSAVGAGSNTFAFIENNEGMASRIDHGDIVYIDPDQVTCRAGREVWLFRIGEEYVLGSIKYTVRGVVLHFDNNAPGWEPVPVSEDDCAGKVVALMPGWL